MEPEEPQEPDEEIPDDPDEDNYSIDQDQVDDENKN